MTFTHLLGCAVAATAWLLAGFSQIAQAAGPASVLATEKGTSTRVLANIAYGRDPRQRMDVYLPASAHGAPVILMVHGGAWTVGNKSMRKVTDNKVDYWVRQKGWILVSTNYRLLPQADPLLQARDVATALATSQSLAASWGGDPARFMLMGHSAGAHLVALLSASPTLAREAGARPWLGTVALDSAALDVERIMQSRHLRFYDRAFGADPAFWRAASPLAVLAPPAVTMLLVCSTLRRDDPCAQAEVFARRASESGIRANVLGQPLTHEEINAQLGLPGAYTAAVDGFLQGLQPAGSGSLK